MSKLAVAYAMNKRKWNSSKKAAWEGNNSPEGGHLHPKGTHPDYEKEAKWVREDREQSRDEAGRTKAPDRPLKGLAHGGSIEEGPSEKANQHGVHKIVPNFDRKHSEVKHGQSEARYGNKKETHQKVISELKSMPKPNLKGLAEGGEVCDESCEPNCEIHGDVMNDKAMDEDDVVARAMKSHKNMYSEGGKVANGGEDDLSKMADSSPNNFDDLSLRDNLESSYTGDNSGDHLGNEELEEENHDIVAKIMRSMAKKDRLPNPR